MVGRTLGLLRLWLSSLWLGHGRRRGGGGMQRMLLHRVLKTWDPQALNRAPEKLLAFVPSVVRRATLVDWEILALVLVKQPFDPCMRDPGFPES